MAAQEYDEDYAAARVAALDARIAAAQANIDSATAERERYTTQPFKGNKTKRTRAKADES